jgi:hypothetical protein
MTWSSSLIVSTASNTSEIAPGVTFNFPSRIYPSTFSPEWATVCRAVRPMNPHVRLIVWIVRKMLARIGASSGRIFQLDDLVEPSQVLPALGQELFQNVVFHRRGTNPRESARSRVRAAFIDRTKRRSLGCSRFDDLHHWRRIGAKKSSWGPVIIDTRPEREKP